MDMLVQFGMTWEMYGVQTMEIPNDTPDVEAYIRAHWREVGIPEAGEYMADSDELDEENITVPFEYFSGVFCDRGSLKTEDLMDAVLSMLDRIMDTDFGHGFRSRYSELNDWLGNLSPEDEAYSFAYDDAYNLLDDICMANGYCVVIHPDDPTVMAIMPQKEAGDWV